MPVNASPARIALVCDWFLPRLGGMELHLADLARELTKAGHFVDVLTTTPGDVPVDGVSVRRIETLRLPGSDLAVSPGLAGVLRRTLSSGNYTLVHVHVSILSPTGFAALHAAKSLGISVVVTFHSVLLKAVPVLRLLNRLTGWARAPVLLSAVSSLVAEQVARAAGGREVIVLPNGVDPAVWTGPPRSPKPGMLVVSAMRLNPKKRALPLIEAFARASANASSARLVIAGEGPERFRIEAAIARLGLGDRVELPGAMSRADLAALYRRADIFVMPSIHESFGLAAIEARFAGLPVVAMRAGGTGDFLTDGSTALLADDDAGLARLLRRLMEDEDLRRRLAEPDPGLERFAWRNVVRLHQDCYAQALTLAG